MTKRPFLLGFCAAAISDVYHYATPVGRGLSSGTSPERIAPESVTPLLSGFVHRNISRGLRSLALDQVRRGATSAGLAANSLKFSMSRSRIRSEEESTGIRCLRHSGMVRRTRPGISRFRVRCCASPRNDGVHQFVFATRGGEGVVMNWVASSIAGPSGVGIFIQNGTRMRVPAIGANAISMLRWAVRYLITGRSGI